MSITAAWKALKPMVEADLYNAYNPTVYNDRLEDGGRSFKLMFARRSPVYLETLADAMNALGFTVKVHRSNCAWDGEPVYRLHVREGNR